MRLFYAGFWVFRRCGWIRLQLMLGHRTSGDPAVCSK